MAKKHVFYSEAMIAVKGWKTYALCVGVSIFSLLIAVNFTFFFFLFLQAVPNGHLYVVVADFGAHSCPKDTELRCENPQLAHHQTPPCNMYCVSLSFFLLQSI